MNEQKPPETGPGDASKRNRGGAPKANLNAATDPAFTKAMREAQRLARRARTRRHAAHLAAARAIVAECGLGGSPLAETVARRVGQVEAEIEELGIVVERVGRTKRDGNLNPSYERRLLLIGQDRQELRQLLDRLIELRDKNPAARESVRRSVFLLPAGDGAAALALGAERCESCGAWWAPLAEGCTGPAAVTLAPVLPRTHPHPAPIPEGSAPGDGETHENFGANFQNSETTSEPTPTQAENDALMGPYPRRSWLNEPN